MASYCFRSRTGAFWYHDSSIISASRSRSIARGRPGSSDTRRSGGSCRRPDPRLQQGLLLLQVAESTRPPSASHRRRAKPLPFTFSDGVLNHVLSSTSGSAPAMATTSFQVGMSSRLLLRPAGRRRGGSLGIFGYTGGHGASSAGGEVPLVQFQQRLERLRLVVIDAHGSAVAAARRGTVAMVSSSGSMAGQLVPGERRRHLAGPWRAPTRPRRPSCGGVLVEVDEHPVAPLLLPPRRGHQVGAAPLELAGHGHGGHAPRRPSHRGLEPDVDVDAPVAGGLRVARSRRARRTAPAPHGPPPGPWGR